jgi:hypothetical protein
MKRAGADGRRISSSSAAAVTSQIAPLDFITRARRPTSRWFWIAFAPNIRMRQSCSPASHWAETYCSSFSANAAIRCGRRFAPRRRFRCHTISRIYDRHFLRTLRAKALDKLARFPGLFDRAKLEAARSIYDFDESVTAPVHGFSSAHDYYSRSSSLGFLSRIQIPTFLLSAIDDPFLPADVLDQVRLVAASNAQLTLEFTARGGHVGFVAGAVPWRPAYYAEWRVCEFLAAMITSDPPRPQTAR